MPIAYELDRDASLIRTWCYGSVSLDEVCEHFRLLGRQRRLPKPLDVLLDWTGITSSPTAEEIEEAGRCMSVLKGAVDFRNCAIAANRDALYGLARMWAVFVERFFAEIVVFRSSGEASAWLEAARDGRQSNS